MLLGTALLGVLLIDFYMFRPFFLTFYGPGADSRPRPAITPMSRPATMTGPLVVLAVRLAVVGAYFQWSARFRPVPGGHAVAGLSARPRPTCRDRRGRAHAHGA